MKKETMVIQAVVGVVMFVLISFGFFLGRVTLKEQVYEKCNNEVKKEFVSDRIQACEKKGGKYMLMYSSYKNNYYESCNILSTEIEDF